MNRPHRWEELPKGPTFLNCGPNPNKCFLRMNQIPCSSYRLAPENGTANNGCYLFLYFIYPYDKEVSLIKLGFKFRSYLFEEERDEEVTRAGSDIKFAE